MSEGPLPGFTAEVFQHEGHAVDVYVQGVGPAVIVIHEIPGITPEVAAFARRVAEAGFTVFLPSLFGTPGRPKSAGYLVGVLARACVAREFDVLASDRSSPITTLLRALAREAFLRCGGQGVGALGMCFTGNFALALTAEPVVRAPVLSQPSLPFPIGAARRRGLHLSPEDLANLKRRVAEEGLEVLGLRFTADATSPGARFERLREELGSGFVGVEIPSGPCSGTGHGLLAHSVLTNDLVDEAGEPTQAALHRVLAFFRERLHDGP